MDYHATGRSKLLPTFALVHYLHCYDILPVIVLSNKMMTVFICAMAVGVTLKCMTKFSATHNSLFDE